MPTRDDRLHQLLAKSSGNKTFTIPGHKKNKLRNVPKRKAKQQSFRSSNVSSSNNNNHPQQSGLLSINALRQHTTGQSIPPLNLTQTRNRQRRRRTTSKQSKKTILYSNRPSTVASYRPEDGPSTLRRRVEAGKRSEWAQIVTKDLQNFRDETEYVKQQKRKEAQEYSQEIRNTINLRATLNNSDVAQKEKDDWRRILIKEQTSNDIVQRAQTIEDKRVALRLKQDRDHHVAILRRKRKEEAQYHENWNQKIINDAKQSVILNAQVKAKKINDEREYLLRTMKEHQDAKAKLVQLAQKKDREEQRIANNHNSKVKGKYVTESERRKLETKRIDLIQTRLMKMGETWVGKDASKRIKEQEHFANKIEGPTGGTDYEIKAAKLLKRKKKKGQMHRRRELLEQMVAKKERKLKKKVLEADFALSAAAEKVKAGMYQAYYDEEKLRSKDQYAHELKKQMEKRRLIKLKNPSGIHARMTDVEKTINRQTLKTMGIGSISSIGGGRSRTAKKGRKSQRSGIRSVRTGRGPESQIFLSTYENDENLDLQSSNPISRSNVPIRESPFHVDTVKSGNGRSSTPFNGYRRSRDGAHEALMKSSRPGTSGASLYSSLRHSHNPRRSKSWFDDEL